MFLRRETLGELDLWRFSVGFGFRGWGFLVGKWWICIVLVVVYEMMEDFADVGKMGRGGQKVFNCLF